jgi:hypothetical protein
MCRVPIIFWRGKSPPRCNCRGRKRPGVFRCPLCGETPQRPPLTARVLDQSSPAGKRRAAFPVRTLPPTAPCVSACAPTPGAAGGKVPFHGSVRPPACPKDGKQADGKVKGTDLTGGAPAGQVGGTESIRQHGPSPRQAGRRRKPPGRRDAACR